MKLLLILLLGACLFVACPPAPTVYAVPGSKLPAAIDYEPFNPDSVRRPAEYIFPRTRSNPTENYLPDTSNIDLLPMRNIRVSVHLMNSSDTLYRYHGDYGREYTRSVIEACNDVLSNTPELWLKPPDMEVPALPRRMRIVLAEDPETGQEAIYEHYDDKLYYYLHKGKSVNRASRAVIDQYGISTDSVLNLFVMGPPRDSFLSKSFKVSSKSGIFLGSGIKIAGWMSQDDKPREHSSTIVHEVLHALGLGHAWTRNDGCPDTPVHANDCWDRSSKPHCDSLISNNLMDYSYQQKALTPCQIARVHARLSAMGMRQRAYLQRDWCTFDPEQSLVIEQDREILGQRDYRGDIYVKRGATLFINNRVHLPEGAGIFVDPGATLSLGPEAILHNDCGKSWNGIFVGSDKSGVWGKVITDTSTMLLNVATWTY